MYKSLLVIAALFLITACSGNKSDSKVGSAGYSDVVVDSIEVLELDVAYVHPVFSEDDKYLFLTHERYEGIYRYELATGELDTVTSADRAGYGFAVADDAVYYVRYEYNAADKSRKSEVIKHSIKSDAEDIIYTAAQRIQGVRLHEKDQLSFFVRDSLFVYDTQTGSFVDQKDFAGQSYLISKGKIKCVNADGNTEHTISDNENIVYVESVSKDSLLVNLAKSGLFLFNLKTGSIDSMNTDLFPRYNGHGMYAYTIQTSDGHKVDASKISIKSLSGDIVTPVSIDKPSHDENPAWSHNGQMLAYNNFDGKIKIAYLSYK